MAVMTVCCYDNLLHVLRTPYLDRLQTGVAASLPRSRWVIGIRETTDIISTGTVLSVTGRGILTFLTDVSMSTGESVTVRVDNTHSTTLSAIGTQQTHALFIKFDQSLVVTATRRARTIAYVALEF
jgi:hypothetical protein